MLLTVEPICLYMHEPRESHLALVKWVLRYVKEMLDFGLQLNRSFTLELAYSDVNCAGCPTSREQAFCPGL